MGQVVADISKDHSANNFSAKLHSEDKSTIVFHNARNYTTRNHKDTNLEQHKYVNLKLIAIVKLRGTLQKIWRLKM